MSNPDPNPVELQDKPAETGPVGRDGKPVKRVGRTRVKNKTSLYAHGEPMIWFTGGALALSITMIVTLLLWIVYQGGATFWPLEIVRIETVDGRVRMGEITRQNTFRPGPEYLERLQREQPEAYGRIKEEIAESGGYARRRLVRVGNFDVTGGRFEWVVDAEIKPGEETLPKWALIVERMTWGRFYGFPVSIEIDGKTAATEPEKIMEVFHEYYPQVRERWLERRDLETHAYGKVSHLRDAERLRVVAAERRYGRNSPEAIQVQAQAEAAIDELRAEEGRIRDRLDAIKEINSRYSIRLATVQGVEKDIQLDDIVMLYPANQIGLWQKLGIYAERWLEFLWEDPREANSEGGVYPAIFGTVVMTLIMSILVVPFGVLAALYLREYAKAGPLVSAVRIAINNLAGVPSIVFGVFGVGFFCYIVGAGIDQLLFSSKLPTPTYGTGGLLWASFTLALLTLPVVIVATEEALAAVPGSMREGSYACGASKWQTIRRIVLPRAMPGIMTGMILAMARGAGEVAPLMLVGAVKLAPELVIDGVFPYFHPERSFMHLGFHIFDLGFQSPDSEAARPMVYTTTLLLIAVIAILNITAVLIRNQLRKKFVAQKF